MDARRSQLCALGLSVAIALGVFMGNSAIWAINPVHYRGDEPRFRPPVMSDANAGEPTPLYGAHYSPDQAMLIRAAVCPGCDSPPMAAASFQGAAVPYFGSREERAAVEARERRAIDSAYASREERREARDQLGMGGPFEDAGPGPSAARGGPERDRMETSSE